MAILCVIDDGAENYPEYVQRWATKEAADNAGGGKADEDEEEDEVMSDVGSISDDGA